MREKRGLAQETLRRKHKNPSGPSRCYDVVSEYGRVLEENAHMVYGIPWSKLPFSLQELKGALIEVAFNSLDEPEFIEKLKQGSAMLAVFIDDEAAVRYETAKLAMAAAAEKDHRQISEFAQAIEDYAAARKEQSAIIEKPARRGWESRSSTSPAPFQARGGLNVSVSGPRRRLRRRPTVCPWYGPAPVAGAVGRWAWSKTLSPMVAAPA